MTSETKGQTDGNFQGDFMKMIRCGEKNAEVPGVVLPGGVLLDVSSIAADYDGEFLETGGVERLRVEIEQNRNLPEFPAGIRIGSPIPRPGKIVCIGLNYRDHARESGMKMPNEPVVFMKANSAFCGPFDNLEIPDGANKVDWEVELGIVIGREAKNVSEEAAAECIAGYLVLNDYSERGWQLEESGQWVKGKSADTFAPLGPWLVTPDEIKDPHDLRLWLSVNDEIVQDGSTRDLIFRIPFLISNISRYMTLLPGDVLSTGTPAGVGLGFSPPRFLNPGDIVRLGIDGLGEQRQRVVRQSGSPGK